jgi:UDP-3-O-[3-hydroxymyristoyl] glucosamine N-acyltransferase
MDDVPPAARWAGFPAEPAIDWKRRIVAARRIARRRTKSQGPHE